jgi:hypothetical protein
VDEEGRVEFFDGVEVSADTKEVECWRECKCKVVVLLMTVVVIGEGAPFFALKTKHSSWYAKHDASSLFLPVSNNKEFRSAGTILA